jgi:hypothetical protein
MHEKIIGICIRTKTRELHLCLSANVFAIAVESYEGVFVVRLGPIMISYSWG